MITNLAISLKVTTKWTTWAYLLLAPSTDARLPTSTQQLPPITSILAAVAKEDNACLLLTISYIGEGRLASFLYFQWGLPPGFDVDHLLYVIKLCTTDGVCCESSPDDQQGCKD